MKERLDQLRAMDSAAFMALPATSFSSIPKEAVGDPEELAAASSPYTNLNGHPLHAEGERRRKEMLDVATMLEERYRVLLPPDRVRRAPEPVLSESASRTQVQSRDGDESETDHASVVVEKLRLRLPARSSTSTTPAPLSAATTPTIKKPRPGASSKQFILQKAVTTPSPLSPTPRTEASPLSPSPTIDMDIPSSPEPEELEPTPPSPLPRAAAVLPQTPISNEASMVEPSSPDVPLSNGAAKASGIVSEQRRQNYTFPEQKRLFTPSEQDMPVTLPDQEMSATPSDQEMLIVPNEKEMLPAPLDQATPVIPEPEVSTLQNQEKPIHDQEMLPTPPEQEKLSTPEPGRRPTSSEPESSITRDQERVSSPPAPDRLTTPLEREKSTLPEHPRSLTPLVRDKSVISEQEQLPVPLEERSVTPERLPTPPERERTITPEPERTTTPEPERTTTPTTTPEPERSSPEPERLPTPPVPERPTTPLVEVTDQDLQVSLPEKEPSIRRSIEPSMAGDEKSEKAETQDKMSVRAESEVSVLESEPEREKVDVESAADKMDVEEDGTVAPVAVIEQAAVADATGHAIPDATLTERTAVAMTQELAEPGPSAIEQVDVPVSEVGSNLDRPVTPEPRRRTESVDIERMPSPIPISSISAPRGRVRKRARLDPSFQPNESASAPVRGPRVPKNHVTYIGASGEMEVTASAIMKAAVHRTQRDVTRHLNAFGVPVPNAIVQMGPPFELPEWVFPPLSPAESEHGDFDVFEDNELNPKTPSERQVTPAAHAAIEAGHKDSMEANPDAIERDPNEPVAADHTVSIEVDPVEPFVQSTRQSGPKNMTLRLPQPSPKSVIYEEDTVSSGDEDT